MVVASLPNPLPLFKDDPIFHVGNFHIIVNKCTVFEKNEPRNILY